MSDSYDDLWAAVPEKAVSEKAMHNTRVAIIEALWWIGEPISPIRFTDIFDGQLGSQWENLHHLEVLRRLGVVKAGRVETDEEMVRGEERCYVPYRLVVP